MGEASIDRIYDALYSGTYLGGFLDILENLPGDLQIQISAARELDIERETLLRELKNIDSQLVEETDPFAIKDWFLKLEHKLIALQDISDDKLQLNQVILDKIDNKQRQLNGDYKNFANDQDDKQENKDMQPERASKRPRRVRLDNTNHNDTPIEAIPIPCPESKSTLSRAIGTRGAAQKKAVKKKKRKSRALDRDDSPTEIPIDPNEPTYCLCEQVSYGEMIGCDNDLCPIEWFHFSCVNLTHKPPKGKWFCPKCRGDKATIMKPRAQFLKELQKYNKEKEEKS